MGITFSKQKIQNLQDSLGNFHYLNISEYRHDF